MSGSINVAEFALIMITVYFIMSSSMTNGAIMSFRLLSGFFGDKGFIRVIGKVDDSSSIQRWFLWEHLFDRRGSDGGIRVLLFGLSGSFKNDRSW